MNPNSAVALQPTDKMFRAPAPIKPISSWGSADPENGKTISNLMLMLPPEKEQFVKTPMNPLLERFSKMFNSPGIRDQIAGDPNIQSRFFDVDNFIKSNAGIFRKKEEGLQEFGVDLDGKPLYMSPDTTGKDFDLGKNKLYNTGQVLQQLGAFGDDEESDAFAKYTDLAGNPAFLGHITGLATNGDQRGAVNTILSEFGHGSLDELENTKDARAMSLAFAAHNFVGNLDKMSPTQQSLALSGMALASFKYKSGESLGDKALITDEDGNVQLTVGNALSMAGNGKNVFSLMKNFDQIDAVQRITFGKGGSGQMALTAERMGLLGEASAGDSAIKIDTAELGRAGFRSVPSAGVGAISGPSSSLPQGYEVVGAGNNPGQVIAVPKGLSSTTSTINGTNKIVSLNQSDGIEPAGPGAFKTQAGWLPTGKTLSQPHGATGTAMSAGLQSSGLTRDPYVMSSMAAASVYGNTVSKKMPPPQNFQEAISRSGTSSGINRQNVNIQQLSKKDQNVNAAINTGRAVVNTMSKFGNQTAGDAAPYVNAAAAGKRLYDVMNDPNATDKQKAEAVAAAGQAGVNISASLGNGAAGGAVPYVNVAMAAYNASKVLNSDMSDEQKAVALRRTAEDTAAAYYTFGLSAVGQWADQAFLGGTVDKIRTKLDSLDPTKIIGDKVAGKVLGAFSGGGGLFGGGTTNKEHKARNSIRDMANKSGFSKDSKVMLAASGREADIGVDGDGGQHQFRFQEKSMGVNRPLSAYDVDYTNDLDFSANMMTNAFARLMSGGKGTAIDQFGGQLANAAISDVGFGQDMNEDTFKVVQENARGFFFQQGIKSKEDAYALANQMFAEQRITEMDQIAIHQGINMAFDEKGYDTAQILMSGRWKGLDVAGDIPKAPGPNFDVKPIPRPIVKPGGETLPGAVGGINTENIDPGSVMTLEEFEGLEFQAGTYGGPNNADAFSRSVVRYQDPWTKAAKGKAS